MNTPKKIMAEMPFIFTDGMGKTEPSKRKLIRKHVMLGKNRGKTRAPKVINKTTSCHGPDADQIGASDLMLKVCYSMIPRQVGSELSFTQFAADVEPPLLHDLLRFSFIAKRVMYPLESCFVFHRKTEVDKMWIELWASDAAYMHAAVFASQAYISLTSPARAPTAARQAVIHHSAALRLLRDRLSVLDTRNKISDSTVLVVLFLTLHAYFMNDPVTAQQHMEGLYNLVDMRGGLMAFSHNTKLIIELLKCDLGIALNNGTKPLFLDNPYSNPLVRHSPSSLVLQGPPHSTDYWSPSQLDMDTDLTQAWDLLKKFCSIVNTAAAQKRQLSKETLLDGMASVMYRLLQLDSFDSGSIEETIRLGLLAFSSHIFLNWQGVTVPYQRLSCMYRKSLLELKLPGALPSQAILWLLIVGSLSIFNSADDTWLMPWVRANIELCQVNNRGKLREQMRAFPWIDFLHDNPGQVLSEKALSLQTDDEAKLGNPKANCGSI